MQKQKLYIIKIGGNVIDHPEKLEAFLKDFSEIQKPKILVHGGGKLATKLAKTKVAKALSKSSLKTTKEAPF